MGARKGVRKDLCTFSPPGLRLLLRRPESAPHLRKNLAVKHLLVLFHL